MAIHHFLILFDVVADELLDVTPFGPDVRGATEAYEALEGQYRDRDDHGNFEIVLIGADSQTTLEQTHSRYFKKAEPVPF
jgi:hypothetical protein